MLSPSLLLILFAFVINSKTFSSPHDHGQHLFDSLGRYTCPIYHRYIRRFKCEEIELGSTESPSLVLRGADAEGIGVLEARISGRMASFSSNYAYMLIHGTAQAIGRYLPIGPLWRDREKVNLSWAAAYL